MKKILIIMLLVFMLSGCEAITDEYYTKNETDSITQDIYDLIDEQYTNEEIDEGFEDVLIWLQELDQDQDINNYSCTVDFIRYEVDTYTIDSNTFIYTLIDETTVHALIFDHLECSVIVNEE